MHIHKFMSYALYELCYIYNIALSSFVDQVSAKLKHERKLELMWAEVTQCYYVPKVWLLNIQLKIKPAVVIDLYQAKH